MKENRQFPPSMKIFPRRNSPSKRPGWARTPAPGGLPPVLSARPAAPLSQLWNKQGLFTESFRASVLLPACSPAASSRYRNLVMQSCCRCCLCAMSCCHNGKSFCRSCICCPAADRCTKTMLPPVCCRVFFPGSNYARGRFYGCPGFHPRA